MKKIMKIVNVAVKKYLDKANLIITKDALVVECLKNFDDDEDVYKSIKICEDKNRFDIKIYPSKSKRNFKARNTKEVIAMLNNQLN